MLRATLPKHRFRANLFFGEPPSRGLLYNLDKLENNLDKLANLTIDELNSGNNVVRKEDSSDRPRETHHKLVVLFFIVSSTFLLVVMWRRPVCYH